MTDEPRQSRGRRRSVSAHLEVFVAEESDLVLAIAVDDGHTREDEQLLVSVDGVPVAATADGQLCFLSNVTRGLLLVDYRATVVGTARRGGNFLQQYVIGICNALFTF